MDLYSACCLKETSNVKAESVDHGFMAKSFSRGLYLKPRLHDEASSTSWRVELASSCKRAFRLATKRVTAFCFVVLLASVSIASFSEHVL